MRIKQISVSGLFGIFDHVIPLNIDERITIIHGPNGFGKTVVMRLLNGLFNSQYSELKTIPFSNFRVEFDDHSSVEIVKNLNQLDNLDKPNNVTFNFYKPNSERVYFTPDIWEESTSIDSSSYWESFQILTSLISQQNRKNLRDLVIRNNVSVEEDLNRSKDSLAVEVKSQQDSEWLSKLKSNIHVHLIESQRLLNFVPNHSSRSDDGKPSILPTVSAYSQELANLMQDKFIEYGTVSQSLDRTFPVRVVKQQRSPDLTDEQLRHQLNELEAMRSRLVAVGLLNKDENSDFQIETEAIDKNTKNILSVYVEDVEKKLSVFNDIANKIDLLKRIINNKFAYSYKQISFDKEKGFVFTARYDPSSTDLKTLSPEDLSSGEQHELVLLYELLFKVKPGSLVLIDEPELSLHVGWQVQFLKDLQEITKLADLDILMATHSPDIIQDRWDLTVELKRPES